ncbi:MAG: CYCXC family (seleno)protein [Terracidiphilus sp.]
MRRLFKSRWVWALTVFAITAASYAQWSNPADDVPAYHPSAPLSIHALPPILSGKQLTGPNFRYHWQVRAYQLAAQIPAVIYQLPCNCRCDRALGHTSLRSCYEGLHGTECSTCAKEAFYAYRLLKQGKTVAQIREGINRHEYEPIDLDKQ